MPGRMPQQIAAAFALCAFAVAIAAGIASSAAPVSVLVRSVVVLLAAYPIGRALGAMLAVALNEHLTAVAASNPIPQPISVPAPAESDSGDVDIIEDVERL